jgi:predicted TIM-barrel fold metal-dependent hydrolase
MASAVDVPKLEPYLNLPGLPGPRGAESQSSIDYIFGSVARHDDLAETLQALAGCNIRRAQVNVHALEMLDPASRLLEGHWDIFSIAVRINPHNRMDELRQLMDAKARFGSRLTSVTIVPSMLTPQIRPDDRLCYPIYAKCCELSLPVNVNVGVPGPRVPSAVQDPLYLDQVCHDFPELPIVMRHGGDPWGLMCVRLLLKWPNLHYSMDAHAPKHYLPEIVHLLNTRGRRKVMYAGFYPALPYRRVMTELDEAGVRKEAWQDFFWFNAARVYWPELVGAEATEKTQNGKSNG